VIEAATEEKIGIASLGTPTDIDRAVRAARTALDDGPWARTTASERAELLVRFADALSARAAETSTLVSRENGMPITLSEKSSGVLPAAISRVYADLIRATDLEEVRPNPNGTTLVRREPVGVVGAIVPWNYPQSGAVIKLAPALAAGCTVVLKPSPETALDPYILADAALEAGFPPGVVNVVLGDRDAGAALVSHPLVDKVAFTGSTAAGRMVGAECGRDMRRMTLELGGKSASLFLDDGDIDTFVGALGQSSFANNGATCSNQTRILVHRSRYDEVIDGLAGWCRQQVIGNPLDHEVTIGPMVSKQHLDRVMGYIEVARQSEARLVVGGGRPTGLDRGWFVEPTVFADVANTDRLAREEVFGPVIAVIPFDDDDEAVAMANDSDFGLAGSVWTADDNRGLDLARRIKTGTIGVNNYVSDLGAPFGGVKGSGVGRELGPEGIAPYLEYKSMYVRPQALADQE